jgi:hypothetical protein
MMETLLTQLLRWIDFFLILPFRIPQDALTGFLVGTTYLAMLCVVIGELTLSMAIRLNGRHIQKLQNEVAQSGELSMQAYESDDKAGFKALNQEASEAWGRHFFTMAAYSAGMLWPVPFALAWMQGRFEAVEFAVYWPFSILLGQSVGYPFIFIPIYIAARIVFGRLRSRLPYFRHVQAALDQTGRPAEK